MRPAELVLLASVLVVVLRPHTRWGARHRLTTVTTAAVAAAAGAHVVLEGVRWQLTPLYLAAAAAVAMTLRDAGTTGRRRGRTAAGATLAALALLAGVVGWALPVPDLPAPTGPYPVGTHVASLVDHDRVAGYGPRPSTARELVLQLWYPADARASAVPGPWVPAGAALGREAASWLGLPRFVLDHVGLVRSHATPDAPVTSELDAFPLVVYVHGWGGFRAVQSGLAESLASRGYVVAALDHTYGAVATSLPDGEVVPIDPAALPTGPNGASHEPSAERLVETFAADLAFLLDELEGGATALFGGRLETGTVALAGHSTGGGAAVRLCAVDRRCGAVVGFDPWVEPVPDRIVGSGLEVPFLSLRSEEWAGGDNDARLRRLHASSSGPSGSVVIAGTTHRDVTMLPLLSPLSSRLGLAGPTPGTRTHEVVDTWTRRWFDHHLLGRGPDPLVVPPRFDEARIDR